MTTQTQGKGKKKNKEVMKVSLDEFNQIDAPHGHSVVSLKMTGLDWAETMADYDQQASETHQIIVPAAPRAQRGPGVDFDSLPTEPPFRVSIFNLPISVEEKELQERFFQNIEVKRVDIAKSSTTVELASRQDLYDALCKDGTTIKNRTVTVCIFGQQPQNSYNSDRYGRGGNSSYGDRYGDRDRNQGGGFGQRAGDKYGDRSGGFSRDRENHSGFSRGFGGQQRGGYTERGYNDRGNFRDASRSQYTTGGGEPESEEPTNWRARPTIKPSLGSDNNTPRPYMAPRPDPSQRSSPAPNSHQQYQSEPYYNPRFHHSQPQNQTPYPQFNDQASSNDRPLSSATTEERPKLIIRKRTAPINVDDVVRNEAIFGQAKPSKIPYEKMNEIEEKLSNVQVDPEKAKK